MNWVPDLFLSLRECVKLMARSSTVSQSGSSRWRTMSPRFFFTDRGSEGQDHAASCHPSQRQQLGMGVGDKVAAREQLWKSFFSDPSLWWDNRPRKNNPRYPDFRHKETNDVLWIDSRWNPRWVQAKIDAMPEAHASSSQGVKDSSHLASGAAAECWRVGRNVTRLCEGGQLKEAVLVLDSMSERGHCCPTDVYVRVLQECIRQKALAEGKKVHKHVIRSGSDMDMLGNILIRMYASCGSLVDAEQVFDNMAKGSLPSWTPLIKPFVDHGYLNKALQLVAGLEKMRGAKADVTSTFLLMVNACASPEALGRGRQVHALLVDRGLELDPTVSSALLAMYVKGECVEYALDLFRKIPDPSLLSSNTIISGLEQQGLPAQALEVFRSMVHRGVQPDSFTLLKVLRCAHSLQDVQEVHSCIMSSQCETNISVKNCLLAKYAKCDRLVSAREVFDGMSKRNLVTWNTMIGAVSQSRGGADEALALFTRMCEEGTSPDATTFVCLLSACCGSADVEMGEKIHDLIKRHGCEADTFVGNALVTMYSKCSSICAAREVFDNMKVRNVVSWNAMIAAYAQHGFGEDALELFDMLQKSGIRPNQVSCICALNACAAIKALEKGRDIHQVVLRCGYQLDEFVQNSLVDMYAKCGSIQDACHLFDASCKRSVVLYTAMMKGLCQQGLFLEAVDLFQQMHEEGVEPDKVTFVCLLNACASLGALEFGRQVHSRIRMSGLDKDLYVGTCLVHMYAKCGSTDLARQEFDKLPKHDVVSWCAMINGYIQGGNAPAALQLFHLMHEQGVVAGAVMCTSVLNVCGSAAALEDGRRVHADVVRWGLELDPLVGPALVDMYVKCGATGDARRVLDVLPKRDVVSFSAMIKGYAEDGQPHEALQLLPQMLQEDVKPNAVTFVSLLAACASVPALEEGRKVHDLVVQSELETDVFVATALVDMYAKAGSLEDACQVFGKLRERDTATWNAMILAFAQHGRGTEALGLLQQMVEENVKLDRITWINILTACSHKGLVDEGLEVFRSMVEEHGLVPEDVHYGCVVDMFSRAGRLDDAEAFIAGLPSPPGVCVWTSLLGACRIHGDAELAQRAAERILELDPEDASAYVLIAKFYSEAGRWGDGIEIRRLMKDREVKKLPGWSRIQVDSHTHTFLAKDISHPNIREIHAEIARLLQEIESDAESSNFTTDGTG